MEPSWAGGLLMGICVCCGYRLVKHDPEACVILSLQSIPPFINTFLSQEAQRENAFLRAQFSERTDCIALEKVEAERRLGAVEAETRRLTESLKETCERHAEEIKKQEERVCTSYYRLL